MATCLLILLFSSSTVFASEIAWREEATRLEQLHGLPSGLLSGICTAESHWRPGAVGQEGEIGLCQLKPLVVAGLKRPLSRPANGEAVARFQKYAGVGIDGIIGPETAHALKMPHGRIIMALFDPYENLHWAATYLVDLRDRLGSNELHLLAIAYNGGPGSPAVRYAKKVRNGNGRY
jgi:soluble lytic murein transglycosylase-like protein